MLEGLPPGRRRAPLLELTKGRWREFIREPSAALFVVLMPILFMTVLGYAFSGDKAAVYGVGWPSDEADTGLLVDRWKDALERDPRVRLVTAPLAELEIAMRRTDVDVIVLPVGESARYLFDPSNQTARVARFVADDVVQRASGRTDPVLGADEHRTASGSRYVDFLVPGLLAFSIMSTSLFGTGVVIVVNRRENLLKRYLATPMRAYDYILSHVFGRGFMLAVEATALLVAAWAIFDFRIAGGFVDFAVVTLLGTAAFTSLAILLGSRTANMATMNGVTNLIVLPMALVGGVWFTRANFPDWLASFAQYLPLTALVDGLRRVALEGVGLASLGRELAVLAVTFVVCTVAARVAFKWY